QRPFASAQEPSPGVLSGVSEAVVPSVYLTVNVAAFAIPGAARRIKAATRTARPRIGCNLSTRRYICLRREPQQALGVPVGDPLPVGLLERRLLEETARSRAVAEGMVDREQDPVGADRLER